jgi:hypothetical protein
MKSTSSSRKLLWLSCDIWDLKVLLVLYSRESMVGGEEAMTGRVRGYLVRGILGLWSVGGQMAGSSHARSLQIVILIVDVLPGQHRHGSRQQTPPR